MSALNQFQQQQRLVVFNGPGGQCQRDARAAPGNTGAPVGMAIKGGPPSSSRYACAVLLPALLPDSQTIAVSDAAAVAVPAAVPRRALGSVACCPHASPHELPQLSSQDDAIYAGPHSVPLWPSPLTA